MYMKKLLLLVTCIILSMQVQAQKKIFFDKDWKKCKEKNAKFYRIVKPSGNQFEVEDYYIDGDVLQMSGAYTGKELLNNERTGIFTTYFKNGKMQTKGEFRRGKRTGEWKAWYSNEQQRWQGNYEDDEEQGAWTYYHKNGKVKRTCTYVDGNVDGVSTFYYDNGDLQEKYIFIKGIKDGKFYEYYKGNKISDSGQYDKDSLVGAYNFYWENGNISVSGNFNDNKKDGMWTYYYSDGNKASIVEYKKGKYKDATFYNEKGEKTKENIKEEDLIENCEYKGGVNALLSVINQKITTRVDVEKANKEKLVYEVYFRLRIDEEGNVIETNWVVPDTDDEDFEDTWGFIRNINNIIETLPRFTPHKAFNRNVKYNYSVYYRITFGKKINSLLNAG